MFLLLLIKNIEAEDEFTFNAEFNSKFKRIKVPLVSAREVVMEGSEGAAGMNTLMRSVLPSVPSIYSRIHSHTYIAQSFELLICLRQWTKSGVTWLKLPSCVS